MRREEFAMDRTEAMQLLLHAPYVHLASVGEDGRPLLRALHGIVVDDWLCFHSAPAGEKCSLVNREAVCSWEEIVAEIPSYWTDPVMACPATTLYRSVQVSGTLRELEGAQLRGRALQRLMETYQPEGGHEPIEGECPRYRKAVAALMVAGLRLDTLVGKSKLAQNRSPATIRGLIENLWKRGRTPDAKAIALLLAANPLVERPAFLCGPGKTKLEPWVDGSRMAEANALLRDQYWNRGRFSDEALSIAHQASGAWVVATNEAGELVGTARGFSDQQKFGYVADVAVREDSRGAGIGAALMTLLLAHPCMRDCARVMLATTNADSLYERLGFVPHDSVRVPGRTMMVRVKEDYTL
ncbi:MAG: GNAT family N-acetyltransferase [Deltaproteobacteria bacterium]|nr:GNAT family N-acetyltransferase [Deltaproteobacteria bacterium]